MALRLKAALLSVILAAALIGAWHLATLPTTGAVVVDPEYARLVGAQAAAGQKSAFPTPVDFGRKLAGHLRRVLKKTRGNKTLAASILGLDRRTVYRKVAELGLDQDEEPSRE